MGAVFLFAMTVWYFYARKGYSGPVHETTCFEASTEGQNSTASGEKTV